MIYLLLIIVILALTTIDQAVGLAILAALLWGAYQVTVFMFPIIMGALVYLYNYLT